MYHGDDMSEKLESKIQGEICKYLEKKQYFFGRSNNAPIFDKKLNSGYGAYRTQGRWSHQGMSDLWLLHEGTFIAIEVKSKKGKASADQKLYETRVRSNGGEYYVVRSIDDVKNLGL